MHQKSMSFYRESPLRAVCFHFWLRLTIGRITDKMVESAVMFIGLFSLMKLCNIVQNSVTSINYEIP